ncbi:hypothetical protein D3C84_920250 [compost metagenome]
MHIFQDHLDKCRIAVIYELDQCALAGRHIHQALARYGETAVNDKFRWHASGLDDDVPRCVEARIRRRDADRLRTWPWVIRPQASDSGIVQLGAGHVEEGGGY